MNMIWEDIFDDTPVVKAKDIQYIDTGFISVPHTKQVVSTVSQVSCNITPQEVTALAPLLAAAENLVGVNEGTAPTVLSDLSAGLIKVSSLLSSAHYAADVAKIERKRVEGRLALEEFPKYCAEKGIKPTESQREAFVDSHDEAVRVATTEAYNNALVTQLEVMKTTFIMGISSVRSIAYGYRDSNSVTGNRV